MFAMIFKCFSSVSEACFKCFICLQTHVESVASESFKNKSGDAHVAIRMRSGGDEQPRAQAASGRRRPRMGT
jgi:hypothetical protein